MYPIALLATYNEARFIRACLMNLIQQGFQVYLIDNESTDDTVVIARQWCGRGLIGIESLSRCGQFTWSRILARKEELAMELQADWFMHVDADEMRLAPVGSPTIAAALTAVEHAGCNAVNFVEFTFVPTQEQPNHDHRYFQVTMRRYYPFQPMFPHRLNLWKRQQGRVDLVTSGGHRVGFPGLRMFPASFPMRHYLFLSREHAIEKYLRRQYDAAELARGWHRGRAGLKEHQIRLVGEQRLRRYVGDAGLDGTEPFSRHPLFADGAIS
ncbi:MAG: glycosyltransferase family 2 protein [Chromatiaceae bacterium]|nr:MAG: glycosyltransferase family 2 protein [Chromatiaceae bacterium]